MSENLQYLDSANFESHINNAQHPVLVDFYADWCGPCNALSPTIEAAADTYADQLDVVKVNVDDNGNLAARYGVRSIPTLIVFKDGVVTETAIGASGKAELAALIERHLQ